MIPSTKRLNCTTKPHDRIEVYLDFRLGEGVGPLGLGVVQAEVEENGACDEGDEGVLLELVGHDCGIRLAGLT